MVSGSNTVTSAAMAGRRTPPSSRRTRRARMEQADWARRKRGHAAPRLFDPEGLQLARVVAEDAREGAERARVVLALAEGAGEREGAGVEVEGHPRLPHGVQEVVLVH